MTQPLCTACGTRPTHPQTLADGKTACSPTCALTLIFQRVESMTPGRAAGRLWELLGRCALVDGKHGGLDEEMADELRFLSVRLGVELVWERVELEKVEW